MRRVARPGGRLTVAVWDALERSPGYAAMAALLRRLFGDAVAGALHAPFALGDRRELAALFAAAGLPDAAIAAHAGTARFPSIASWVHTDIKGWTLADALDDAQYARLLAEAERDLRPFVAADGTVAFAAPAHIVTTTRR
jgi:hypothetical protein